MRLLAEILLAAFFISYFIDKRTVLNGKLLCGSMLCFMIYLLQSMQNSPPVSYTHLTLPTIA